MENPRIIVSMTSHGLRLLFIDSTLKSILKLKMQADLITVTLTKEDQDELSTKIRDFLTKNNIEIIIADEDLHSHEKYYYAMKKYPNDIIITIDDDIEYNNKLIETLYKSYLDYPHCIHASKCRIIKKDSSGEYMPYLHLKMATGKACGYPNKELCILGYGGVLYPPNILGIDDLEVDSIKNFIYADDLYITYITYIKNIRVVCLNFNYGKDIQGIKTILPLYLKNVHGHKNNEYIEKINSLLFRDSKKLKYYTEKTITDDTLIVSFTSYPPRIRFCYQVIRSLLDLSLDKSLYHIILVLAVPNFPNKEKDLPVSLVELVNSTNLVLIIWYDRDIMSHKKLIPTLKEFPNNPILVTDDDIERPYDWLLTFYKDHKKYPNDIIIGASFYFLDIFLQFKETSILQAHIEHNKTAGMVYNFARPANGAGGTLYPPHTFITKEFYDEDLMMKISPTSDEMWQYVFNVIDGKTFRHTSKHYGVFSIEGSLNVSLFSLNIKKYNTIYKNILKRFPLLSRLIAQRQRQIIISIGYHKSYNDYFIESCKSIINLNMDFKCVIVLTNELIQELPHNIQEFIQDNGIEIILTEKDLREYNKYYYPMMKYPYHGVMVFEGNMMYKVGLISKMFSRYLKYPYSVIGCCCHVIKYNSLKGVTPYYSWTFDYKQSITPAYNLIIDPISPAFYPPGCLGFTEKFKDNIELFFGYEELYLKFIENYRNVAVLSLGLQDFLTYLGRHTLREYKIHLYDDKAFLYKNMQRMVKNTVFNSGFNVDSTQSSNFNDFIKYRLKTRMIL